MAVPSPSWRNKLTGLAFNEQEVDHGQTRWIPKNIGVAALKLATMPLWLPIRFIATIAASALNILSVGYFTPLVNRGIVRNSGLDAVAHSALAILLAPASVAVEVLASASELVPRPAKEPVRKIERLAAKMWTGVAPTTDDSKQLTTTVVLNSVDSSTVSDAQVTELREQVTVLLKKIQSTNLGKQEQARFSGPAQGFLDRLKQGHLRLSEWQDIVSGLGVLREGLRLAVEQAPSSKKASNPGMGGH